jgi:hypothetical protein
MKRAIALLVGALNLENFTSPHFKIKFSVAGILCVHISKEVMYFHQL